MSLPKNMPNKIKRYLAENDITLYYINASKIAQEIGLGNRTNTILQSAFFRITNVIPVDLAVEQMKKFIVKSYSNKGQNVVDMNFAAVDRGGEYHKLETDPAWKNLENEPQHPTGVPQFVTDMVNRINGQEGDLIPVSRFADRADGTWPQGTAAFEKRGVANFVPEWNPENCIQCNKCSFVCPHAAIRPFVLNEDEYAKAPFKEEHSIPAVGKQFTGMRFRAAGRRARLPGLRQLCRRMPRKERKQSPDNEAHRNPTGQPAELGLLPQQRKFKGRPRGCEPQHEEQPVRDAAV